MIDITKLNYEESFTYLEYWVFWINRLKPITQALKYIGNIYLYTSSLLFKCPLTAHKCMYEKMSWVASNWEQVYHFWSNKNWDSTINIQNAKNRYFVICHEEIKMNSFYEGKHTCSIGTCVSYFVLTIANGTTKR